MTEEDEADLVRRPQAGCSRASDGHIIETCYNEHKIGNCQICHDQTARVSESYTHYTAI